MNTKTIEVLDRMTSIPVIATRLEPESERDRQLLAKAGFGLNPEDQRGYVRLARLIDGLSSYDPHAWGGRTMPAAHRYIIDHWDELKSGDVVDVEFALGEVPAPRASDLR